MTKYQTVRCVLVLLWAGLVLGGCEQPSSSSSKKPQVTVTGVIVKDADGVEISAISLLRDTDYQFSAELQGGTNATDTGVSWEITDVEGNIGATAIDADGKLSIDAAAVADSSFKVKATSKADPTKSGSVTVTVFNPGATLPAPEKPGLSAGAVTWTPVSGASSHTVKLYKSGGASPVQTYANQTSGCSVLSDMRSNGAGSYTVTVSAIGDGTNWLSSAESPASDAEAIAALAVPSGLSWNGNSAEWTGDSNAASYTVELYKGGIRKETVPDASSPLDLTAYIADAGLYAFTVQAIGLATGLYLDSAVSGKSGVKQVGNGGLATITLTPLDKSGTLAVTGGGASIAQSNGSLTISVSGGSFSSFAWIVDGVTLAGTTSEITLSGTDYSLGGHSVTVYALDGGVPWSPTDPVKFTVTP
jgi:hypothetical protein